MNHSGMDFGSIAISTLIPSQVVANTYADQLIEVHYHDGRRRDDGQLTDLIGPCPQIKQI